MTSNDQYSEQQLDAWGEAFLATPTDENRKIYSIILVD